MAAVWSLAGLSHVEFAHQNVVWSAFSRCEASSNAPFGPVASYFEVGCLQRDRVAQCEAIGNDYSTRVETVHSNARVRSLEMLGRVLRVGDVKVDVVGNRGVEQPLGVSHLAIDETVVLLTLSVHHY